MLYMSKQHQLIVILALDDFDYLLIMLPYDQSDMR